MQQAFTERFHLHFELEKFPLLHVGGRLYRAEDEYEVQELLRTAAEDVRTGQQSRVTRNDYQEMAAALHRAGLRAETAKILTDSIQNTLNMASPDLVQRLASGPAVEWWISELLEALVEGVLYDQAEGGGCGTD